MSSTVSEVLYIVRSFSTFTNTPSSMNNNTPITIHTNSHSNDIPVYHTIRQYFIQRSIMVFVYSCTIMHIGKFRLVSTNDLCQQASKAHNLHHVHVHSYSIKCHAKLYPKYFTYIFVHFVCVLLSVNLHNSMTIVAMHMNMVNEQVSF